jgi:1-deoxy-D-xylulose-5-phosphate synthase
MVKTAQEAAQELRKEGREVTLVNARFVSPIDKELIASLADSHRMLVTIEENVKSGGFGQKVSDYLFEAKKHQNIKLINIAVPDMFIEHGGVGELQKKFGLDAESIINRIKSEMED